MVDRSKTILNPKAVKEDHQNSPDPKSERCFDELRSAGAMEEYNQTHCARVWLIVPKPYRTKKPSKVITKTVLTLNERRF